MASLSKEHAEREPEHPSEAVDALIEAGQEEGILEESDRDLIQSVVEFGDKTVREVMTPRPEIIAVPSSMTIAEFTELVQASIPTRAFRCTKAISITSRASCTPRMCCRCPTSRRTPSTVRDLMKTDVYFVPETKLGSDLLREMQRDNIRMAIVMDEYGGVGGVVTIEDLVEEIVGEIRDEHEKADVVKESDSSYIFNGNTDVDLLEKLLGVRPEENEATTIAGLVSELAGHIPKRRRSLRRERTALRSAGSPPNAALTACASACSPNPLPTRCVPDVSRRPESLAAGRGISDRDHCSDDGL